MPDQYTATVVHIADAWSVVVNKGAVDGIKLAHEFMLVGLGDEIRDPDTGDDLGRVELVRGKVKVINVQDRLATLQSDSYSKPAGRKTVVTRKGTARAMNVYAAILGGGGTVTETETIDESSTRLRLQSPAVGDKIKPIVK